MADWTGIAQVITAVGIVIVGLYSIYAKLSLDKMALSLKEVKSDVRKVELATNSMKDALVKAAGEAGETKGRADEKADQGAFNAKVDQLVAEKSAAGQISVDSAEISVESAQITVDKKAPK